MTLGCYCNALTIPIGFHLRSNNFCSIRGILSLLGVPLDITLSFRVTEFRPILIIHTKVIRVSSQKGVILGVSQFVQSTYDQNWTKFGTDIHYDVCKVCANFRENPSDRACTKCESKYAYGAILGRNVRNFQIGRPYSFHTAAGDSGQMTEMYVTIMT